VAQYFSNAYSTELSTGNSMSSKTSFKNEEEKKRPPINNLMFYLKEVETEEKTNIKGGKKRK
jgi:hypothetical protein